MKTIQSETLKRGKNEMRRNNGKMKEAGRKREQDRKKMARHTMRALTAELAKSAADLNKSNVARFVLDREVEYLKNVIDEIADASNEAYSVLTTENARLVLDAKNVSVVADETIQEWESKCQRAEDEAASLRDQVTALHDEIDALKKIPDPQDCVNVNVGSFSEADIKRLTDEIEMLKEDAADKTARQSVDATDPAIEALKGPGYSEE